MVEREVVVKEALEHYKLASPQFKKGLEEAIRRHVTIRGFRDPFQAYQAYANLLISKVVEQSYQSEAVLEVVLYVYNDRGLVYLEKSEYDRAIGEYVQAIEVYSETLRINPNFVPAYYGRGNAYSGKGDYDLAIKDYNEAIRLRPRAFAPVYYGRGNAYIGKDAYDLAIKDYNEALGIDPNFAPAYYGRGNAYFGKDAYDLAIKDYNEALGIDPNIARAYHGRGSARWAKSDYDLAIADYNEAIRLMPNFAHAYHGRGNAHYGKDAYNLAIEDYDIAIRLMPKSAAFYLWKGSAYHRMGCSSKAIEEYDNTVRLCPDYETDFINTNFAGFVGPGPSVAKILVEKAVELLRSVAKEPPENADDYYYTGVERLFSNDRLSANRCFKIAWRQGFADSAKIEKHLGNLRNRE